MGGKTRQDMSLVMEENEEAGFSHLMVILPLAVFVLSQVGGILLLWVFLSVSMSDLHVPVVCAQECVFPQTWHFHAVVCGDALLSLALGTECFTSQ